jgi:hypothetical protein
MKRHNRVTEVRGLRLERLSAHRYHLTVDGETKHFLFLESLGAGRFEVVSGNKVDKTVWGWIHHPAALSMGWRWNTSDGRAGTHLRQERAVLCVVHAQLTRATVVLRPSARPAPSAPGGSSPEPA